MKTITEPSRTLPVRDEVDVLVTGGGPAGFGAAVAAARMGARTLLVERYGCLGGQATGGLIVNFNLMDNGVRPTVQGIAQEVIDRLLVKGAALAPSPEDLYSNSHEALERWKRWGLTDSDQVRYCVHTEPEALKALSNEMINEAGGVILLHAWAAQALVDEGQVIGAVIESKAGRQAILAKVTIDATGDADIAASAGAPFDVGQMHTNLVYRLGGVDTATALQFQAEHPQQYQAALEEMAREGISHLGWHLTMRPGIILCSSPAFNDIDILNPADLSRGEIQARHYIQRRVELSRRLLPGFEEAYLLDTASQFGIRESRRIVGEYTLTDDDIRAGRTFSDVVTIANARDFEFPPHGAWAEVPYRTLLPRGIDNLLVAGRCISTEHEAQNTIRRIPQCIATGQAAGVAAALAVRLGVTPRQAPLDELQQALLAQGAYLGERFARAAPEPPAVG
jgi:hypothetical protein